MGPAYTATNPARSTGTPRFLTYHVIVEADVRPEVVMNTLEWYAGRRPNRPGIDAYSYRSFTVAAPYPSPVG